MENSNTLTVVAYSPKSAAKAANVGVNKIYDWLNAKTLKAKKDGGRTIITADALKECIAAMPDYEPGHGGPANAA